jgi:DNA invertase Pin-like site-specific DNA recombinase
MLCIGYVRVSTSRQRDEGSSLPAQRQRIARPCRTSPCRPIAGTHRKTVDRITSML